MPPWNFTIHSYPVSCGFLFLFPVVHVVVAWSVPRNLTMNLSCIQLKPWNSTVTYTYYIYMDPAVFCGLLRFAAVSCWVRLAEVGALQEHTSHHTGHASCHQPLHPAPPSPVARARQWRASPVRAGEQQRSAGLGEQLRNTARKEQ